MAIGWRDAKRFPPEPTLPRKWKHDGRIGTNIMQISQTMNARLNEQISAEFTAAHKYLAMACAFEDMGLRILGRRFFQQYDEERGQAMKIVRYLHEVGGKVVVNAVDQPRSDYKSVIDIVQAALDSEIDITKKIHAIVALADSEKDYASRSFLEWFVDEQVEEISTMTDLLNLVKLAGPNLLQVEAYLRHQMIESDKQ